MNAADVMIASLDQGVKDWVRNSWPWLLVLVLVMDGAHKLTGIECRARESQGFLERLEGRLGKADAWAKEDSLGIFGQTSTYFARLLFDLFKTVGWPVGE